MGTYRIMTCCGKKFKKAANTGLHIAVAYTGLVVEKITGKERPKYKHTDARLAICRDCEFAWWRKNKKSLWCKLCLCFMPEKARIEKMKCPKGFWEILNDGR